MTAYNAMYFYVSGLWCDYWLLPNKNLTLYNSKKVENLTFHSHWLQEKLSGPNIKIREESHLVILLMRNKVYPGRQQFYKNYMLTRMWLVLRVIKSMPLFTLNSIIKNNEQWCWIPNPKQLQKGKKKLVKTDRLIILKMTNQWEQQNPDKQIENE